MRRKKRGATGKEAIGENHKLTGGGTKKALGAAEKKKGRFMYG